MSEEIKEILYYFKKYHFEDTMIDGKETKLLYDYITNLQNQLQQKENIIKEVRDILRKYICNPSGLKDGWHIDCWNDKDISKLNEDLGMLEKGNKYDN